MVYNIMALLVACFSLCVYGGDDFTTYHDPRTEPPPRYHEPVELGPMGNKPLSQPASGYQHIEGSQQPDTLVDYLPKTETGKFELPSAEKMVRIAQSGTLPLNLFKSSPTDSATMLNKMPLQDLVLLLAQIEAGTVRLDTATLQSIQDAATKALTETGKNFAGNEAWEPTSEDFKTVLNAIINATKPLIALRNIVADLSDKALSKTYAEINKLSVVKGNYFSVDDATAGLQKYRELQSLDRDQAMYLRLKNQSSDPSRVFSVLEADIESLKKALLAVHGNVKTQNKAIFDNITRALNDPDPSVYALIGFGPDEIKTLTSQQVVDRIALLTTMVPMSPEMGHVFHNIKSAIGSRLGMMVYGMYHDLPDSIFKMRVKFLLQEVMGKPVFNSDAYEILEKLYDDRGIGMNVIRHYNQFKSAVDALDASSSSQGVFQALKALSEGLLTQTDSKEVTALVRGVIVSFTQEFLEYQGVGLLSGYYLKESHVEEHAKKLTDSMVALFTLVKDLSSIYDRTRSWLEVRSKLDGQVMFMDGVVKLLKGEKDRFNLK